MLKSFLWIEDDAERDLQAVLAPVYASGRYYPTIATTATDGYRELCEREFDVVVVDIRILPGEDEQWRKLYLDFGERKNDAKLGMHLLDGLFQPAGGRAGWVRRPSWLQPSSVGLLTVEGEGELKNPKERWQINHFIRKGARLPETVLVDLLDKILDRSVQSTNS